MRSRHEVMSFEEFVRLPRHPGWKYEYYGGMSHITPRSRFAAVQMRVESRAYPSPLPLRGATEEDEAPLVAAYVAAFADAVEYCDAPEEATLRSARENIRNFLEGERGEALPSSSVALDEGAADPGGAVAGAALVIRDRKGIPLLDMLLVRPEWQRRGLATALVSRVLRELLADGESTLRSRYHLGNDASRAWHHRFGFALEPAPVEDAEDVEGAEG